HHINKREVLDGADNDGDGFVDNISTIKGLLGSGGSINYQFNENERLRLPPVGGGAPMSHGTFVASVAMKDIDHSTFIGASGDIYSSVFLYKMIEIIKTHDLRFNNMSFGFGDRGGVSLIDRDDHYALENFIKNQSSVLHVIAAGNYGINFDESRYSE